MQRFIIDRFEADTAIVQDAHGETRAYARRLLPAEAREGDVLILRGETFSIDEAATVLRREQMLRRLRRLTKHDPM